MGDSRKIMGHDHTHADEGHGHEESDSRKLAIVSIINSLGFAVELAGGILFGSVALISDSIHMLFDALAYVMAFAASFTARRYGKSEEWSYGIHRIEPLAAFLNGALLIPMIGYILWESYRRFLSPIDIGTIPTLAIAVGGLLVNVVSVFVLNGNDMSLNERGAFYHLLGDAGGSIAVIVSVVVIEITGFRAVDPIVASLIAVILVWSAIKVLRGSGAIFFHKSPVDIEQITTNISEVEGIENVQDIHAWQVCSQITVATTHIATEDSSDIDVRDILHETHQILSDQGVDHATVEICYECDDHTAHLTNHSH